MREILFRGKRVDNGEWICGNLTVWSDGSASIDECRSCNSPLYAVIPETVGQFTELTDKNGERIFDGDIGKGFNMLHPDRNIYQVVYEDNGFYYCDEDEVAWHPEHIQNFEVIGNIHENPELLKGEENKNER
ncbi:MAG: hypothetical protein J6W31_05855 [Clostridia bacterium]|nr:hypothetical protein [Clostridia bacterium]